MMLIITATEEQADQFIAESSYPEAEIMSLSHFLQSLEFSATQKILQPIEQSFIWQECILKQNVSYTIPLDRASEILMKCWKLIHHWEIPGKILSNSTDTNTQWFYQCAQKFIQYCEEKNLIDETRLLESVVKKIFPIKKNFSTVMIYGFLYLTPLEKKLFTQLNASNYIPRQFTASSPESQLQVFLDPYEELTVALDWAIAERNHDPEASVCLVVPELEPYYNFISSYLSARLEEKNWHIYHARPAKNFGLIATALMIIELSLEKKININKLISLLRSPYFEKNKNLLIRARYVKKLRDLQLSDVYWSAILSIASKHASKDLYQALLILTENFSSQRKNLSEWTKHWQSLWEKLNVLLSSDLNEKEIFLEEKFFVLIKEFSELLSWEKKWTQIEAFQLFREYCETSKWQMPSPASNNIINIISPFDAFNQKWDAVWCVQTLQNIFPIKFQINPLIDKKIQSQYHVTEVSSTAKEIIILNYYDRLISFSEKIIFSYTKKLNEQLNTPAIFCNKLVALDYKNKALELLPKIPIKPKKLELDPWKKEKFPGGSNTLKTQQACPMQAFARYRLKLDPLLKADLGFTAIERGQMIHRALQFIWEQLEDQKKLLILNHETRDVLLSAAIKQAFEIINFDRKNALPKSLLALEKEYLKKLLNRWLEYESERPAFKIFALEHAEKIYFAEREWNLRIDRIDELVDGRLLLIDYKTGRAAITKDQLFKEAQLPLYTITQRNKIDAIALAKINLNQMQMCGLTKDPLELGALGSLTVVSSWQNLKEEWEKELLKLADDFIIGSAALNPIDKNTCSQCGRESFCRIFEVEEKK